MTLILSLLICKRNSVFRSILLSGFLTGYKAKYTHHSPFNTLVEHKDTSCLLLPNHLPKVAARVLKGTLWEDGECEGGEGGGGGVCGGASGVKVEGSWV